MQLCRSASSLALDVLLKGLWRERNHGTAGVLILAYVTRIAFQCINTSRRECAADILDGHAPKGPSRPRLCVTFLKAILRFHPEVM
jgi:hypothetical protein